MADNGKLDPEEIQELQEHCKTFWRLDIDLCREYKEMYFDEHKVGPIPDTAAKGRKRRIDPERVSTAEAAREVDQITAFYPEPAALGVDWRGEGKKKPALADKIEIAINEAIDQLNPAYDSPRRMDIRQMVLYGRTARLILPGDKYYWDFPWIEEGESEDDWAKRYKAWKRGGPLPVLWMSLPAETTYPPSFGSMGEIAINWQEVTAYDLQKVFSPRELGAFNAAYTDANRGAKAKWDEKFTFSIYADRRWVIYAVLLGEGKGRKTFPLREIEHKMDACLIRILPGEVSGVKEPGHYWQSVLRKGKNLIKIADRLYSLAATASKFDSLPTMIHWKVQDLSQPGAAGDMEVVLEGNVIEAEMSPEGKELEQWKPFVQPQFGDKTHNLAREILQRAASVSGAHEILAGPAPVSNEAAWARHEAVETAKAQFSGLTSAVIAADVDAAEMIMRAVQAFGLPILLKGKGEEKGGIEIELDPKELKGHVARLKGDYQMRLPINQIALAQTGLNMLERVLDPTKPLPINPEWVLAKYFQIEQPWEHMEANLMWRMIMSPGTQAALEAQFREQADIELAEERYMPAEQAMAQFGNIPPEIAQQLAGQAGLMPMEGRAAGRAGAPFSVLPGGPKPETELPPLG